MPSSSSTVAFLESWGSSNSTYCSGHRSASELILAKSHSGPATAHITRYVIFLLHLPLSFSIFFNLLFKNYQSRLHIILCFPQYKMRKLAHIFPSTISYYHQLSRICSWKSSLLFLTLVYVSSLSQRNPNFIYTYLLTVIFWDVTLLIGFNDRCPILLFNNSLMHWNYNHLSLYYNVFSDKFLRWTYRW